MKSMSNYNKEVRRGAFAGAFIGVAIAVFGWIAREPEVYRGYLPDLVIDVIKAISQAYNGGS